MPLLHTRCHPRVPRTTAGRIVYRPMFLSSCHAQGVFCFDRIAMTVITASPVCANLQRGTGPQQGVRGARGLHFTTAASDALFHSSSQRPTAPPPVAEQRQRTLVSQQDQPMSIPHFVIIVLDGAELPSLCDGVVGGGWGVSGGHSPIERILRTGHCGGVPGLPANFSSIVCPFGGKRSFTRLAWLLRQARWLFTMASR